MTTIAIDQYTIAADGLEVTGSEVLRRDCKKIYVGRRGIYALAGTSAMFWPLIEWHDASDRRITDYPKADGAEWSFFVIAPNSRSELGFELLCYRQGMPYPSEFPIPSAFGSGAEYAQAMLALGKSARAAVEMAAKLNVHTGGEILEINILEALTQSPTERPRNGNGSIATSGVHA